MTLLEIRTNLVKLSGRYDLVVDTSGYADNGANFFIQAGQRMLDTLLDTPKSSAEFHEQLTAGDYLISLSEVRSITAVWAQSTSEGIHLLAKNTLDSIRNKYGYETTFDNLDQGFPQDWALAVTRDQSANPVPQEGMKLLILPPPEETVDIIIEALYLSPQLTADGDESWWSLHYPDLLIQAALYKAETFLRNTQGANDWLNAIQRAVTAIDHDQVEQASAQVDQMKNSWNFRHQLPRRSRDYGSFS